MIPPELISTAVDICAIVSSLQSTKKGNETNLKAYYQSVDGWAVEIIQVHFTRTIFFTFPAVIYTQRDFKYKRMNLQKHLHSLD